MTQLSDWAGVANGNDFTVEQKRFHRMNADVPEDHERNGRMLGLPMPELKAAWRIGVVDLFTKDGQTQMVMTEEQAARWKSVRH
jgi:hypothetical protein